MFKLLLAASAAAVMAGGSLNSAADVVAGGNGSQASSSVEHSVNVSFTGVAPCVGDGEELYDITLNLRVFVEHFTEVRTEIGAGTVTQTGTFTAVPAEDPSLPTFTGWLTLWAGFNTINNEPNQFDSTETTSIVAKGSDGSRINFHEVSHGVFELPHEEEILVDGFLKSFCR